MAATALIVDPGLTGRYEHVLFDTAPIFAGLAGEGRLYAITARKSARSARLVGPPIAPPHDCSASRRLHHTAARSCTQVSCRCRFAGRRPPEFVREPEGE